MYRRIMLTLDGSALAESALSRAVSQAKRFQAELVVLRVLEPLSESLGKTSPAITEAEARTREMARTYLERIAARVREDGVQVRVEIIEGGRPHHEIVQFVQANDIDLIVICTRGHSGFSRWLMGSVVNRVVRGANVPVQLVQATKEKDWRARSRYSHIIQLTAQPSS